MHSKIKNLTRDTGGMEEEMKKMFKKVMVTLMTAALLMGVLAAQTDTVQAGNKAFANSSCSPNN